MAKLMIEERMGGVIEAENVTEGAGFRVIIPESRGETSSPPSREEAHAAWASAHRESEGPPHLG